MKAFLKGIFGGEEPAASPRPAEPAATAPGPVLYAELTNPQRLALEEALQKKDYYKINPERPRQPQYGAAPRQVKQESPASGKEAFFFPNKIPTFYNAVPKPEPAKPLNPFSAAAQKIYDQRDLFYMRALKLAGGDFVKTMFLFLIFMESSAKSQGYKLSDLRAHPEAGEILRKSEKVKLAFRLRDALFPKKDPEKGSAPRAEDALAIRQAKLLAEQHAQQGVIGLMTQLNVKDKADDKTDLKKVLFKKLLENHPDKNPHGDPELVKAANAVLSMIKDGTLDVYRDALQAQRAAFAPR